MKASTRNNNGKQASVQEEETAPLLEGNDAFTDGEQNDDVEANHPSSRKHTMAVYVREFGSWFYYNGLVILLAVVLVVGTIAVVVLGLKDHPLRETTAVCTTSGCVLAAAELLKSMSPRYKSIDPCTDFQSYVCEGFDMSHDLRDDQTDIWTGQVMAENAQLVLRRILEAPFPGQDLKTFGSGSIDEKNFQKMQDAYSACMNESQIAEQGSQPLLELLSMVEELYPPHPGRPIAPTSGHVQEGLKSESTNSLSRAIGFMMSIGAEALFSLSVQADDKEPEKQIVSFDASYPPGLPSKDYYKKGEVVQLYNDTISTVLKTILPRVPANLQELVDSLINFETKIAGALPNPEDAGDPEKNYNPRTLEEASVLIPQIDLEYLISQRAPGYKPSQVIVGALPHLEAMSGILEETKEETIRLYLIWKTIQAFGPYIEDESVQPLLRLENVLAGKEPDSKPERWRTCTKHVDSGLGWILSRFYLEKAFSQESKDFGDRIISDIKDRFVEKLDSADWMSKEVRKRGIEKVRNIIQKVGYPTTSPNVKDPAQIRDWYVATKVNASSFFSNKLSMNKDDVRRNWAKAGKPTDKNEWVMTAPTVNAYYQPSLNQIVFPAGIMQSPAFHDPSIPQYLSYGAFGSVSGHELSHAFDSNGRHYDMNGRFTDWWDNRTVDAFKEKANCFVSQYSNYSVPNSDGTPLHINGLLTLGENIADAGGVTASFQAWKARDREVPGLLLPGLQDLSKEQLFFVNYATFWCGVTRNEEKIKRVYTDPHSPFEFRIKGTMANSREFKEAFGCEVKEPECELW